MSDRVRRFSYDDFREIREEIEFATKTKKTIALSKEEMCAYHVANIIYSYTVGRCHCHSLEMSDDDYAFAVIKYGIEVFSCVPCTSRLLIRGIINKHIDENLIVYFCNVMIHDYQHGHDVKDKKDARIGLKCPNARQICSLCELLKFINLPNKVELIEKIDLVYRDVFPTFTNYIVHRADMLW